jgi:hypothetical protein
METMIKLIPTSITGLAITFVMGFVVGCVPAIYLLCVSSSNRHIPIYSFLFAPVIPTALGATAAGIACFLFAVIQVDASYWTFAFPSTILVVCGTNFIFATGALFVARIAHDDEQGVAAGVYHTSSQVCTRFSFFSFFGVFPSYLQSI